MDAIDEKILKILRNNARLAFVDIAAQLEISEGTIRSRVKKLVEDDVIKKFTITTASKNLKALIMVRMFPRRSGRSMVWRPSMRSPAMMTLLLL